METVEMKSLVKQIRGVSYKPGDLHEGPDSSSVMLLRANNISDGRINFEDVVYIDTSRVSQEQLLQKGDVLICASSGSKNLVGKAAIFAFDEEVTFGAFCKVVRPANDENADYISMFFQSPYYRRKIADAAIGVNINNIRNEHIDELQVRWPSMDRRKEAVEVLTKVDSIIRRRKVELQRFDELIKARFVELFGNPIINEKGWNTAELNSVCDGIGDGLHGTPEYDENGDYPFINGNNLMNGIIEITPATKMVNEENYRKHFIELTDNAILLSINGTLGNLAFYNGEAVMLGKSACYCNLKPEINREFVYGVMKTDAFMGFLESNATASTIKNVGLKAIRGFRLILPPEELQTEFVEFSKQVDKSKITVQKALDEAQRLFDSLMQQYFG